jgi:hypothetical protein
MICNNKKELATCANVYSNEKETFPNIFLYVLCMSLNSTLIYCTRKYVVMKLLFVRVFC